MTIAMQPIYTQTASGSVSGIVFNNIPQTFTDLKIVVSIRSTSASVDALGMVFNNSYSGYSRTQIIGNGSTATSSRVSYRDIGSFNSSANTANTFASFDIYIPNYTSSNFKQSIVDSVRENNSTEATLVMTAQLSSSTAAITSILFDSSAQGANFAANSTFTLYGITKG
jgi:hypothetical protein